MSDCSTQVKKKLVKKKSKKATVGSSLWSLDFYVSLRVFRCYVQFCSSVKNMNIKQNVFERTVET